MVVVMEEGASEEQVQNVVAHLVEQGFDVHRSTGAMRTVLGAVGPGRHRDPALLEVLDGVHEVLRITEPYKLASRTFKKDGTVFDVGDVRIGGDEVIVMAGPCSAESPEQVQATAAAVKRAGGKGLRGGAFKPRSSPYAFQGLGEEGLRMLRDAADQHGLTLISEVMDISQIPLMDRYVDIYQVGARNMQNYTLLRELGRVRKPVLLKRGHFRDHRRVAAVVRIHPVGRQHAGRAVRARHSHVRDLHPQHDGHLGDSRRQEVEPPADLRRSRVTASASAIRCRPWRGRRSPLALTAC